MDCKPKNVESFYASNIHQGGGYQPAGQVDISLVEMPTTNDTMDGPRHNAGPAGRIYLDERTRFRDQAAASPADALAMRLGYLMRAFVQGQLTTAEYTQRSSELLDEWDVLDRRDDANPNSDCEPVEFDGLAVADLDGEVA